MNPEVKVKRTRSPNFPTVTLEKSLSQAQVLLEKYSRNQIAWEVGVKALGYSAKGSGGKQAMASLGYYGLIQAQGLGAEKKIAVSDLAFKILADKRTISPERELAIKEAALNPPIFQKIIEHYRQGLPADDALEWELISTYKFNKESVRDFIATFRGTLDFAKVYESGIIGEENTTPEAPIQELPGDKPMTQAPAGSIIHTHAQSIPFSTKEGEYEIAKFFLGGEISVRLVATAPISKFTQKTIDKLIKHLELDKEELPADDIVKSDDE
jgi:hypothetical protein